MNKLFPKGHRLKKRDRRIPLRLYALVAVPVFLLTGGASVALYLLYGKVKIALVGGISFGLILFGFLLSYWLYRILLKKSFFFIRKYRHFLLWRFMYQNNFYFTKERNGNNRQGKPKIYFPKVYLKQEKYELRASFQLEGIKFQEQFLKLGGILETMFSGDLMGTSDEKGYVVYSYAIDSVRSRISAKDVVADVKQGVKLAEGVFWDFVHDPHTYNTAYVLYSDLYDNSYKPMYDQYAQASQQAGTTPEPIAEKVEKADTTMPEEPDTTASNYIVDNFTLTDKIDLTHIKLEDISKAIVEQWDISKGKKLATLDSSNVKITRTDKDKVATITVDFSSDFVHSDDFYNKVYKVVLGGQTFNLTADDKGIIAVDNIAQSTINGKTTDTNKVTVKTKIDEKAVPTPETKLPHTGAGIGLSILGGISFIGLGILGFFINKKRKA
ncbi:LPXTG cell wall anchor domain-containing protein [Lactococcus garvieae]|uniref:LPXTG cell wall anchor domain-containing protein n=1 Tax=Lactococcus garvieae TaxID=1363 RepID=UPI00254BAF17|nr:LPXTG cell wall anchor domain-containing protein [Lactococcus garvieae]